MNRICDCSVNKEEDAEGESTGGDHDEYGIVMVMALLCLNYKNEIK